jgi:hypothetical protein
MIIHTKILRKPLNKIWLKALKFLDELRKSQDLQIGIFKPVVCLEVFLPFCEDEHRFLNFCFLGFPLSLRTEIGILL